ncbi:MAG: SDR family oxidoreductase [Proteobacteria bacterium]|nr:SDR family oxidoreductase [Pseudomonadota bacterium]
MTDTDRKTIIVTGATSGIGLALIYRLRDAGYFPILTGRNPEKVSAMARETGAPGYHLDVANESHIQNVIAQIKSDHGPVSGLVNNAGIWLEGEFSTHSADDIRTVIETNTLGTMLMTHAVLPDMLSTGRGTVINVVSTGALYTRKMISVYSASKWAIRGFTGCLEVECAPKGVRVMGFYPGKVNSSMYETAGIARDLDVAMTPEQAADMLVVMLKDEGMVWSHVSGRSIRDYV